MELERMDLSQFSGRIAYEHLHRYAICRESLAGKRVLDLACGTGYGSTLLAGAGAIVTGLDISSEAIKIARARYQRDGVKFIIGSCYDLPFEDGAFDVVVANEMIEHVDQHDTLLGEVKRVLAEDGLFLISTPNKPVYNKYKPPNVFHISEMEIPEFQTLLSRYFAHIRLTATRMALVSVGYELEATVGKSNLASARIYHGSVDANAVPSIENGELSLRDPEYVLAACSNKPLEPAGSPSTLFYSREDDLWLEHEKVMAWASQLHEEDEVLRATAAQAYSDVESLRQALHLSEAEKSNLAVRVDDLRAASQSIVELSTAQRGAVDLAMNQQNEITVRLLEEVAGTKISSEPASIGVTIMRLGQKLALAERQAADLEQLTKALAESQQQTAALRAALDHGARNELQAQFDLRESESARQRAASELLDAQARLATAHQDYALMVQEVERLQAKHAEIQAQASLGEERRTQLEDEAAQLRADLDAVQKQFEAAIEVTKVSREEAMAVRDLSGPNSSGFRDASTVVSENASDRSERDRAAMAFARRQIATSLLRSRQFVAEQLANSTLPDTPAPQRSGWALIDRFRPPFKTAIFNSDWIRAQRPGGGRVTLGAYLAKQSLHQLDPHPLFSVAHYISGCPGLELGQTSPLEHYLFEGWRQGLDPHPWFANDWYLNQNPDVLEHNQISPLEHYLTCGWKEGRWPNPGFDPGTYLDRYPDVRQSGMEPLTHFVVHGLAEGRGPHSHLVQEGWSDCLKAEGQTTSLLDYLLTGDLVQPQEISDISPEDAWPPQALRDFVLDGYGEEGLRLYWYLYSVMAAYVEQQSQFPGSDACKKLLEKARQLSAAKVVAIGTAPQASIIIPVYNNVLDTLLCIMSILATEHETSFEIIIADDGSNDATAQLITSIGGAVRYIRQPRNLGFLQNCNEAVKQAAGSVIVLLNNDTLVMPRWLDELLLPLHTENKVGLVGSKLVNWDGTLQEAGGIYWRDGSAWNFGRGGDPRAPEFSYLKDVDYCSGASIAVPADIWREIGGFDEQYSPAYCEDSDLAFRLRDLGHRTLYNPFSEVIHHEGRSHGRDTEAGTKAYQIKNQQKLFDRWQGVLALDHYPNAENVLRARDRSGSKGHVLFIDHYVPQWDCDAGSRTIFQYMKLLVDAGLSVSFWPDNLARDPKYTPALQALGIEVIYGAPWVGRFGQFIAERGALYDMVFISRPHVAKDYIAEIRSKSSAQIFFYGQDLHFKRMQAAADIGENVLPEDIAATKELELEVCASCDVIFYPDPEEVDEIRELVGGERQFLANPVFVYKDSELAESRSKLGRLRQPGNGRLLFVAGFNHTPNREGIIWFANEVFPLIAKQYPGVLLDIAGSNPPPEVIELGGPNVVVHGFVPDERLHELYEITDVVVAPLRYGAGVKGKVIEAMAKGVPVATTSFGAQGIANAPSMMFLGNTKEELADAVVEALSKRETARRRAAKALDFIGVNYSENSLKDLFLKLLAQK